MSGGAFSYQGQHKPLPDGRCEHRWRTRQTKIVRCLWANGWREGWAAGFADGANSIPLNLPSAAVPYETEVPRQSPAEAGALLPSAGLPPTATGPANPESAAPRSDPLTRGRVHIINGQPCDDPTCYRSHGIAGT